MYSQKFFLVYLKEVQMVFKEHEAWGESGPGMCPILTHYCLSVCVCVPFTCMCLAFPRLVQSAINLSTHWWTLCSSSFFCMQFVWCSSTLIFQVNNLCTFKDLPFVWVFVFLWDVILRSTKFQREIMYFQSQKIRLAYHLRTKWGLNAKHNKPKDWEMSLVYN